MARTCINHKDTASTTMCHQCHNPICKSCSLVTPQGIFCSPECSILNRDVKARLKEGKPKDGMTRVETMLKLIVAFLLVCGVFYGIHALAERQPKLKRIDMIGRLLEAIKPREPGRSDR